MVARPFEGGGRMRPKRIERFGWSAIALTSLCVLASSIARAAEPDEELFRARLEAGEFAPAVRLAERAPDAARRDERFAKIARAQAKAGARAASITSAAEIGDDRVRAAALVDARGARGKPGGMQPNFDDLIAPDRWDPPAGGSIEPFEATGGVYVDAAGVLRRNRDAKVVDGLAGLRLAALDASTNVNARRQSPLRKVSLTRLEKQVQLRRAAGKPPTEEMSLLAGLERIQYVFVYPQSGDIVLAGPADQWITGGEGRVVARTSRRPVLRLDDLVVILRHLHGAAGSAATGTGAADVRFGCSITPGQEALKRTKVFLEASAGQPLQPGGTRQWLQRVRANLGRQKIEVFGIDSRTRAARVMVEADYRMKLVGMGLEEGVLGVESYLESLEGSPEKSAPTMDVLRWWFTLEYEPLKTTASRDAFELAGQGVQVQSENEVVTASGQREGTGASQPLNQHFAESFTRHFPALAEKYPVYAELQNLFDLALVAALIKTEGLAAKVGWHLTCFGDPAEYPVALAPASTSVETVINHRSIKKTATITTIVAGASGGVSVDPWKHARAVVVKPQTDYRLKSERTGAAPKDLARDAWWWD